MKINKFQSEQNLTKNIVIEKYTATKICKKI